jgi:hypothetical protein
MARTVQQTRQLVVCSLVGQYRPAFTECILHFDHATADLNTGAEFASIKGFGQVVIGHCTKPVSSQKLSYLQYVK